MKRRRLCICGGGALKRDKGRERERTSDGREDISVLVECRRSLYFSIKLLEDVVLQVPRFRWEGMNTKQVGGGAGKSDGWIGSPW